MENVSGFVKRIRDIMRNDPGINGDAQRIEQIVWMLFLKVYAQGRRLQLKPFGILLCLYNKYFIIGQALLCPTSQR